MGDDRNEDTAATGDADPPPQAARDAGWEARALARVKPHVRQLSKQAHKLPDGWETDTVTRLEDYFRHDAD